MNNAIKSIKSLHICEDDYVVLACSYGPDSMCLLDLLLKENFNVVVAHVNHKLRKESDEEYKLLEEYCKNNNIIFEGYNIDNYEKGNIEELARIKRYSFFKSVVKKYNASYLFTAHHGDDLVETVLMRLSRGASFKGYAGFGTKSKLDGYTLVRPLINVTKDEILKYDKENIIPFAIDQTNLENIHTRNKYRHGILPILKEINPKIHTKFIKFSNTINEYNDYVDGEVNRIYNELYVNNGVDLNDYNLLHPLIQKLVLNKILFNYYNNDINIIKDEHINLILKLINSDKVNGYVNLPDNLRVTKYYNILEFKKYVEYHDYDYILNDKIDINDGTIIKIDNTDIIKSNYLIRLNSKDIKLPIHVRNKKVGDKISLKNAGTKKVSDIFIDCKIKKDDRDIFPLICDSNDNILWIPGVKKSKFDNQTTEEYDIILKYIKKGEKNEK